MVYKAPDRNRRANSLVDDLGYLENSIAPAGEGGHAISDADGRGRLRRRPVHPDMTTCTRITR